MCVQLRALCRSCIQAKGSEPAVLLLIYGKHGHAGEGMLGIVLQRPFAEAAEFL